MNINIGDIILDQLTRAYFPVKAYLDQIPKDKLKVSTDLYLLPRIVLSIKVVLSCLGRVYSF
jgi:hypothetical protein